MAKISEQVFEDFTVVDENYDLITGLVDANFTADLFDPNDDEVSTTVPVTVNELGSGHYRAIFTPNTVGTWYLVVYHATHFPWGKANNIPVYTNDIDDVATNLLRVLGLTQENHYIDNAVHNDDGQLTSSRIRIYSDAGSVGTDNNVTDTYTVTVTYDTGGLMIDYKVIKI